ncbi:hypothetical protein DL770_009536 [Monosporascus sp. CRB-9-2]|nr:hypothetical protein DL770_009536 [Monosporascus sp. CRB-9-2]
MARTADLARETVSSIQLEPAENGSAMAQEDGDNNTQKKKKPLAFWLAFSGLSIIAFLFALDATTLAVAVPSIAEQLHGTTLEAFWASIVYVLGVVVTQPIYTGVSDVFGRKPPLYFAFLLFTAGSLVFALAQTMASVIVGRVLQGLAGGGLDLLSEIIVADITTLQERSLFLGLLALPLSVGSILGPTLGAVFSSLVSWRWIGWINLPLLGVSFTLILFFLRLQPIDTSFGSKIKQLDWAGMLLSLVGTTVFVLPLSWAGPLYPWRSWQTILPLLIGAAVLVAFALYESRSENPIFPPRLLKSRTARLTLVGNFMHGALLYSILQYAPMFYQAVGLETVIGSAVTLLPTSISSVVFAASGVIIVGVVGKGYCWTIRSFWVIMTVGTGLLALLDQQSSQAMRMGIPVLWGAGVGALMRLLHLPMQASVPTVDDTAAAIGLLLSIRLMGGLVGLAVGSTIFGNVFASSIATVGDLPGQLAVLRDANEAVAFIPMLRVVDAPPEILDSVLGAYLTATRAIFYAMTAFSGVGFLTSVFMQEHTLQKTELGRQRFQE